MVTQTQVESNFVYGVIPKLRLVHGENLEVFQEEWVKYLKELNSDRVIPSHAIVEWKLPKTLN